jgi:hypothetical protein
MHIKRDPLASKILPWLCGAAAALLAGCSSVTLTNLTPSALRENPSQIYTFALRVVKNFDNIPDQSISARIVLDGQTYPMKKNAVNEGLFEFEYQLPAGRDDVAYYYLVDYGTPPGSETYTEVSHVKIVHRYVLSLEANRGPVGASVGVLGGGFTVQDVVAFGGTPARTVYASSSAISFFVPPLPSDKNYPVTLNGSAGNSPVGTFHIDPTSVTVAPTNLALAPGEKQTLTFTLSSAAPEGGILLDVTTDVPESVIMPEVLVPQGQTSVSITIEGGRPGNGSLFLKGYGGADVSIPVVVAVKQPVK